jgi:hypothetical protein
MPDIRLATMTFALALALACVLSLPAVAAAEAGWMVGGKQLTGSEKLATTAEVSVATLQTANATIICDASTLEVSGGEIVAPSSAKLSIEFKGCQSTSATCELLSPTIGSEPLLGLELTLAGTLAVKAKLKPSTGTTIATLKFVGSECALAGTEPLTGSIGLLMPEGQMESTTQQIGLLGGAGQLKLGSEEARLNVCYTQTVSTDKPWRYL